MKRFTAFALILTFAASELQAQEPTPARRSGTVATKSSKSPAPSSSASTRKAASQGVQPAVAIKTKAASNTVGTGVRSQQKSVVPASSMEYGDVVYDPGMPVAEEVYYDGGDVGCDSCGTGGCDGTCGIGITSLSPARCGIDICNPPAGSRQLAICLPSHGWVQIDYLNWYQNGMNVPALLTTTSSATGQGILGQAGTQVLVGDKPLVTDRFDGGRIRFGWWFANNPTLGMELEYFGLGRNEFSRTQQSTGDPLLARPFFNVQTGLEDSELVAQTGVVNGIARINAYSELQGGAIRLRQSMCCGSTCKTSFLTCGPIEAQSRIDGTLGWRNLDLDEGLTINEDLRSQTIAGEGFLIQDSFRTRNQFNGAEIGAMWQGRRGYWSLDLLLRTSFGNTRQEVTIDGSTVATELVGGNLQTTTYATNSGFLAVGSNSGSYVRQRFGVVPEFGATVGYQLTQRMRLTAGYTFIYWSSVVRPGDQIDLDVNPSLLPPATNTLETQRPRFQFRESDYIVQGLNLGAEYRW